MTYLLIVEGQKGEYEVFAPVLERYGFNVVHSKKLQSWASAHIGFDITELNDDKNNIVIAQAPKNRLGELLKLDSADFDFDLAFKRQFNGIFLIFDVDHTSNDDLERMIRIHSDETDKGLLLVSSPCIEILSEPERKNILRVSHLRDYKKERNIFCSDVLKLGCNAIKYIADNFESLALQFLELNYFEFNEPNVMEHPQLVVNKINVENERTDKLVVYIYFTTVVYVLIAVIFGLNREIENYGLIKKFLKNTLID